MKKPLAIFSAIVASLVALLTLIPTGASADSQQINGTWTGTINIPTPSVPLMGIDYIHMNPAPQDQYPFLKGDGTSNPAAYVEYWGQSWVRAGISANSYQTFTPALPRKTNKTITITGSLLCLNIAAGHYGVFMAGLLNTPSNPMTLQRGIAFRVYYSSGIKLQIKALDSFTYNSADSIAYSDTGTNLGSPVTLNSNTPFTYQIVQGANDTVTIKINDNTIYSGTTTGAGAIPNSLQHTAYRIGAWAPNDADMTIGETTITWN